VSSDVADALNCTTEAARQKLQRLYDQGRVDRRKTGRTQVWWFTGGERITPDERAGTEHAESVRERGETAVEDTPDKSDTSPATATQTPDDGLQTLVEDVGRETLPGSGEKLDERVAALHAVMDYLREHGTATPGDFQSDVYPDHPARYTDGSDPARSWWKNAMYPALRAVAEQTDRLETADTTGEWSLRAGAAGDQDTDTDALDT
jgi:hypothetical protein